ncbi:MAG: TonB-dependent receptor [Bacteroidetes bacterium]|jgi:outer membrane receptor for ferrienterochelin and colicin|nr:TonB-dependent receptor [Bacteroidota bacterium]
MSRRLALLSVLLFVLVSLPLLAGNTGKLSGRVLDARTGEPLPGANVLLEGTSQGAMTDADGRYVILNIPPGQYTAAASFIGYRRLRMQNIRISVDFTTTQDFRLEEGDIQMEEVIVRSERSPLIRQDLTNPVSSISAEAIGELPVTEISEIIGLQAGVTVDDDGSIHVRGGLGNEIAYTLNGVNINNPYGNSRSVGLATNAVQEVSVSSGTFSAEYGTALSGVVNYVTREGGQKWMGSFRYLGGDRVGGDPDLFFNIGEKVPTNDWRMEASLGGPLLVDDLKFFASGVYTYSGGYLYARRFYRPEDSYLSREGFPTGDPRRGSSGDAYYFGPIRNASTDLVGGPSGDGEVVPLNWSRSYNLQGNLSYRLSADLKVKLEAVYDFSRYPSSSSQSYWFKPDGRSITESDGLFQSLELTHVLGDRTFYTLKGSYIIDRAHSGAFDDWNDPRYLPAFYSRVIPNTTYLTGGTDLGRFQRSTYTTAVKFDLVSQMFDIHEVKVGAEFRQHDLEVESYTLQFRDPARPSVEPSFTNVLIGGANFLPYIPDEAGGYVKYRKKPVQASAYVQDKIELFTSIILNVGVRWDYFEPASVYHASISDELTLQDSIFLYKNLQDAEPKHMLAPRVSVSYPITDQGTIRFSYGHFYQIGSLSSLYTNSTFRAPLGTSPTFGNANVQPQRSVQYELGLQQGLTPDLKIELTGYYKDVRDYIFYQTVITPRGDKQYRLLTNLAYANTRGLSFSLTKRRAPGELVSASIDYTFQVADGNRTEPTDELFYSEQKGRLSETYLVAQDFDRSHTLTSTVMLTEPDNWVVSMIGYLRTGTPYTPSFPSNVVPIQFEQNSDRQPVQWNVDLKAEKFFHFAGLRTSIFVLVDNLFDTQNDLYAYANSGRALYNIEQVTDPTRFLDLRNRITRGDPGLVPLDAVTNYYANPGNVSTPRLVRAGFSVIF